MSAPTTLTIFGMDNGDCRLYGLTQEQFDKLVDAGDWDTIDKFEIALTESEHGYVPDYVATLASMNGWGVGTN